MSRRSSRGLWPLRDLPVVGWLTATVVVALTHPFLPAPRWLLIHLLLLGAATHAILVWSRYFADAVLHTATPPGDRTRQSLRLALLNSGVLLVVVGVPSSLWALTLAGALAVGTAVAWHGVALVGQLRAALPARFAVTVHYYIAAAAALLVGGSLGVLQARTSHGGWHERLLVAHALVNLLGWIGLTALGTLVTLWPTVLRTRMAPGAERTAGRVLPLLLVGMGTAAYGGLADSPPITGAGLGLYLVGLGLLAPAFLTAAWTRPPRTFAALSVASALLWLGGCLVVLTVTLTALAGLAGRPDLHERLTALTPFLATGFGAQLLLGASSYLIPVALGGGPGPVRAADAVLGRGGPGRVVATNTALLVCLLPAPSPVRVAATVVVLGALATFLPLLVLALRASRAVRSGGAVAHAPERAPRPRRQAVAGLALVLVALAVGVGVDRVGPG